jgi:hypothetical protein
MEKQTMTMLKRYSFIAAILSAAIASGSAQARAQYRTKQTGFWSQNATWQVEVNGSWQDPTTPPGAGDTARIRIDHRVALSANTGVTETIIDPGGVLFTSSKTFTTADLVVDANAQDGPGILDVGVSGTLKTVNSICEIDGEVRLAARLFTLSGGVFQFDDNFEIYGSGRIVGCDGSAIKIANGRTLTNHIAIEGAMKIEPISGTAYLVNEQLSATQGPAIRANGKGTLELTANLNLQDVYFVENDNQYRPTYEAVGSNDARLKFSRECDGTVNSVLKGNVLIDDCGTIEMTEDITTEGSLTFTMGKLIVAPSKTFIATNVTYTARTHVVGVCE